MAFKNRLTAREVQTADTRRCAMAPAFGYRLRLPLSGRSRGCCAIGSMASARQTRPWLGADDLASPRPAGGPRRLAT